MTFYAENETGFTFDFDWKSVYEQIGQTILDQEECPYETQVSLILTDNENIQKINRETRAIDAATDVLSFPNVEYDTPANFEVVEEQGADCFEWDTGELILGDIILSVEKVVEQAQEYGHSIRREFAFLVAHSMLHLCGYDHMTEEEEKVMFAKQEEALQKNGITRD